eukprot:scaffold21957_cov56-Phaeocystis_antarctica.AAC.2
MVMASTTTTTTATNTTTTTTTTTVAATPYYHRRLLGELQRRVRTQSLRRAKGRRIRAVASVGRDAPRVATPCSEVLRRPLPLSASRARQACGVAAGLGGRGGCRPHRYEEG